MVDFKGFSVTPDIEELIDILWRKKIPKRVHNIELSLDPEILQQIADRYRLKILEKRGWILKL